MGSEFKSRRDSRQPRGIFPHILELSDLGGSMAQKVSHLAGREGFDATIRLFYSVDQRSGEGVAEGVEALPLQPRRLQNAVILFAEVHRAGVVALLIGN